RHETDVLNKSGNFPKEAAMKPLVMLISAASVLGAANASWAQRDAASKIDGAAYEAPYFYDTSDMYQQAAYEHARVLQGAHSFGEPVPQSIAKEHTAGIRTNVQAAQRHLASLRERVKGNAAAAKHFDEIEGHHKKALALCNEIDAATDKGKGDAATVRNHAAAIVSELKAAHEKHTRSGEHLREKK